MLNFIKKSKWLLFTIVLVAIAYFAYNEFTRNYHRKSELDSLKTQIALKEIQFQEVLKDKEKLQDSSNYFENVALQYDHKVDQIKYKVNILTQEKNSALSALNNVPKATIDSFLVKRYAHVPKHGINVLIDKNVGNEIAKEVTERDFLHEEVGLLNTKSLLLINQVDTLKLSLSYSKQALIKADTALKIRSQQLSVSKDLNSKLEKDLKTAKRKAYLSTIRGTIAGFTLGVAVGVFAR
jgi:hypothetical protein